MNALTSTTIRGRIALDEVRALFDQLYLIDGDIAQLEAQGLPTEAPFNVNFDEMHDLLNQRRNSVLTKLENKGIRIAPDPIAVPFDAGA